MKKSASRVEGKKSGPGLAEPDNFPFSAINLSDAKLTDCPAGGDSALFPLVAIGASAGGVEALQGLFKSLPADSGRAYIVAVHLAPDHSSHLAEILANSTSMAVIQVQEDIAVKPDTVYVIPPAATWYSTAECCALRHCPSLVQF